MFSYNKSLGVWKDMFTLKLIMNFKVRSSPQLDLDITSQAGREVHLEVSTS